MAKRPKDGPAPFHSSDLQRVLFLAVLPVALIGFPATGYLVAKRADSDVDQPSAVSSASVPKVGSTPAVDPNASRHQTLVDKINGLSASIDSKIANIDAKLGELRVASPPAAKVLDSARPFANLGPLRVEPAIPPASAPVDISNKSLDALTKGLAQALPSATATALYGQLTQTFNLMNARSDRAERQTQAIQAALANAAASREPRAVAIVFFNSARLNVKRFHAPLRSIFVDTGWRVSRPAFQLELHLAANDKSDRFPTYEDHPETRIRIPKLRLDDLPQGAENNSTSPALLDVAALFNATPDIKDRRCVIVIDDAQPAPEFSDRWKQAIPIDVIRIGSEPGEGDAALTPGWMAFCAKTHGFLAPRLVLPKPNDEAAVKTFNTEFAFILKRLAQPD